MNAFYQSPLKSPRPYHVGIGGDGFDAHWHSELEILYVLSGSLTVTLEDRRLTAASGCAVFVGPATPHAIAQPADGTRYLVMEFGHALLGDGYFLFHERSFSEPLADLGAYPALRDTLDAIARQVQTGTGAPAAEWALRALLFSAPSQRYQDKTKWRVLSGAAGIVIGVLLRLFFHTKVWLCCGFCVVLAGLFCWFIYEYIQFQLAIARRRPRHFNRKGAASDER